MPVRKIDYCIPEDAVDYKHLDAVRHDFDAELLEKAFVLPEQKGIKRYIPKLTNLYGWAQWLIGIGELTFLIYGIVRLFTGTLYIIFVATLLLSAVAPAEYLLDMESRDYEIIKYFRKGYNAYLNGYLEAIATCVYDNANGDKYINSSLSWANHYSRYGANTELDEAFKYGMYLALKMFMPSRPCDLIDVLTDALYYEDCYFSQRIEFRNHTSCIRDLTREYEEFVNSKHIHQMRYDYYKLIYPNGFDGKTCVTNPDEIKTYVGSDGEIYRYKTEAELLDIKQRDHENGIKVNVKRSNKK